LIELPGAVALLADFPALRQSAIDYRGTRLHFTWEFVAFASFTKQRPMSLPA
jgi:hypothetical protein